MNIFETLIDPYNGGIMLLETGSLVAETHRDDGKCGYVWVDEMYQSASC